MGHDVEKPLASGERRPWIQADDARFLSSMRHNAMHLFRPHDRNQTCHELHTIVMRAIALGLDLDEMFFEDKINEQRHNLRLLSYPPIKTSLLKEGQTRAAAHSGEFLF